MVISELAKKLEFITTTGSELLSEMRDKLADKKVTVPDRDDGVVYIIDFVRLNAYGELVIGLYSHDAHDIVVKLNRIKFLEDE